MGAASKTFNFMFLLVLFILFIVTHIPMRPIRTNLIVIEQSLLLISVFNFIIVDPFIAFWKDLKTVGAAFTRMVYSDLSLLPLPELPLSITEQINLKNCNMDVDKTEKIRKIDIVVDEELIKYAIKVAKELEFCALDDYKYSPDKDRIIDCDEFARTSLVSDVRFIYPDSDFELYDAFHGGLLLYLFMMVGILIWDPKPKGPVQGLFF